MINKQLANYSNHRSIHDIKEKFSHIEKKIKRKNLAASVAFLRDKL